MKLEFSGRICCVELSGEVVFKELIVVVRLEDDELEEVEVDVEVDVGVVVVEVRTALGIKKTEREFAAAKFAG